MTQTSHPSDSPAPRVPDVEHAQLSSDLVVTPPRMRNALFFGADGLRAGWGILIFILLFGAVSAVVVVLAKHFGTIPVATQPGEPLRATPPRVLFLNDSVSCAGVLLITWLMAAVERRRFGVYGLGGRRKLMHGVAGMCWGLGCLSLLVLGLRAMGLLRFDGQLEFGFAAFRYATTWAAGFALVGLFEETLLRGYLLFTLARGLSALYGRLLDRSRGKALGFWTAALLLSLLFGAGHHGNAGESPLGLLSAALASLVFCLSLWWTGSLWWAIGFHAAWDWAQSFLYGVADSGTISAGRLFATHPVGRPILSGGLTGPEGSLFVVPVLALATAAIVLTLRRRTWPLEATDDPTLSAMTRRVSSR